MLVFIHFHHGVEAFFQRFAIGGKPYDGQDDFAPRVVGAVAADPEEFGGVACVDVIAARAAGVAGEDGEVGASDS